MKKIYAIEVVTKKSGKHALYFYIKAHTLADAVVFAANFLVPDLLEISTAFISAQAEEEIYTEIYDADNDWETKTYDADND